jgi:hypothetical protein
MKFQGQFSGLVAVRGMNGLEWLLGELQKDKANMIDMALPFTKKAIEGNELSKFGKLKPFLFDDDKAVKKP